MKIMKTVTVSSKFQVVIPREVRESLGLTPGTRVQILQYENRLELIPLKEPRALRGFIRGIDTEVDRDEDRV
jgi:AbrB family looped-hinge helix DNA binding protein